MSKNNAWMPLYIGDYMRDTSHLDATEHGAYLMLIMHYWNTGPVKDDDRALANITRAGIQWPEIASTIRAFFTSEGGFLRHKRIDAERAKASDLSDKRRAAGQARQSSNRSASAEHVLSNSLASAGANAEQLQTQSHSQSQSHIHSHIQSQSHVEILSPANRLAPGPRVKRAGVSDPNFQDFWSAYPRKAGKAAAERAWAKAMRVTTAEAIGAALRAAKWPDDPQYIPHPATWLNQGRWDDEAPRLILKERPEDILAAAQESDEQW
jgi:uncharacterized protein YdaU (DUF1376 family)